MAQKRYTIEIELNPVGRYEYSVMFESDGRDEKVVRNIANGTRITTLGIALSEASLRTLQWDNDNR
jgi:hypothetical protein